MNGLSVFTLVGVLCAQVASVGSQLSVIWNGTTISGPVLIFHDEILLRETGAVDVNEPGSLICRSENGSDASWAGAFRGSDSFVQYIGSRQNPRTVQLRRIREDLELAHPDFNGLWSCRHSRVERSIGDIPVGLYQRGDGRGAVTMNTVCLASSSFTSRPSTLVLFGDTSGGPPVMRTWEWDGVEINATSTDDPDSPFSTSLAVNGVGVRVNIESRYRSTLTVTGYLPGVYRYSVTNRITPGVVSDSIDITDTALLPTNLMARQIDYFTVLISWTPPPILYCDSYLVTLDNDTDFYTRSLSPGPYSQNTTAYGDVGIHSIHLSVPPHQSDQVIGPVEVVIRDTMPPDLAISSLSATSANISWTQPEFSLPVTLYTVSLDREIGRRQLVCSSLEDSRNLSTTGTFLVFEGLEEFSTYVIVVTAAFDLFQFSPGGFVTSTLEFTTLSAVPSAPPANVLAASITSSSITVTWDSPDCVDHNGLLACYRVILEQASVGRIPVGEVIGRNFTAIGLTPYTNYTVRVAGININGSGPFTEPLSILTSEDRPGPVRNLRSRLISGSLVLTWSSPEERNGVIINYEVAYSVVGASGSHVAVSTTSTTITIDLNGLPPDVEAVNVSVSAYTRMGRGEASSQTVDTVATPATSVDTTATLGDTTATLGDTTATLGDTTATLGDTTATLGDTTATLGDTFATLEDNAATPEVATATSRAVVPDSDVLAAATMINFEAEAVSASSVRVSWDPVDIAMVTGYIVYYSRAGVNDIEGTITTCANPNPVTIYGLVSDTIYLFQVAAVVDVEGGAILVGERSEAVIVRLTVEETPSGVPRGTLPFLLWWHFFSALIVFTVIGLVACYISKRRSRLPRVRKSTHTAHQTQYWNARNFIMKDHFRH